jgi:c-di-GMP-binding flagellar brake protein YcgR
MVERVTHPAHIGHLLMRLMDTRAPLTLSSDSSARQSTTLLLNLDFNAGELALDEPFPDLPLTPGGRLLLRGRVDGSTVDFTLTLGRLEDTSAGRLLVAPLPAELRHSERRGSHRASIPPDLELPPATFTNGGHAFRGRLLDVSEEGAGSMVPIEGLPGIGDQLACSMSLPGTRLIADVRVCSALLDAGSGRLGLRFAGLNSTQLDALRRAIASLDRQMLRRYAGATWV